MRKSTKVLSTAPERSACNGLGDPVVAHLPIKAFELLAAQPSSLVGLTQPERNRVVVSAVSDGSGREHVVSRFGDSSWDFTSGLWPQNIAANEKVVSWPSTLNISFLNDVKAALYIWMRRGKDGTKRPAPGSVVVCARQSILTISHFSSIGLGNFSDVTALHVSDYIANLQRTLQPTSILRRLYIVNLVWAFYKEVTWPLAHDPWAGEAMSNACGIVRGGGGWNGEPPSGLTAKTPVIPPSVQAALFRHAESHLKLAGQSFLKRDISGRSSTLPLISLRDAISYVVQITTGMRNSELAGIKSGCWRTETRNGVVFHWIRTVEHKTRKGPVDYLAPPETLIALELLSNYAKPLQERLRAEIRWLESQLQLGGEDASVLPSGITRIDALQRLMVARGSVDNLFLSVGKMHKQYGECRVDVFSNGGFASAMERFALAAGVKWKLATHQCRRTFAWTVANTRMGRMGLIFLKWQLKHTTMTMSQLYASNPNQDESLYEDFYEEMVAAQGEVLESWFEDEKALSGGAGKRILKARATPIADFNSLLAFTAESVTIRSTGHSWCLAERGACVGDGLYEATRCGTCSDGVIDSSHSGAWQGIHLHNLELLKLKDCGPAIQQRAERAIKLSAHVLNDLGVEVPSILDETR
jgi:hypothetical protein